ncbi:CvpA family protein [Halomonas beimenensis]|uniref:Colicin V production protein n=1 Tax=Halomonas beimenensis TaxID=475662 RepID=A0A291P8B2_9GAMM|nr:CvpA family protein [Halomonas beimenensis]ATJ83098.1 colicin V production protein [Halomonas beimenensis]
MTTLTWLDWAFVAVLAVTGIAGLVRGLVREALGLAAWIVALLAARWLAEPLADRLVGVLDSPDGRLVLAFVLVVLGVILACGVIIRLIHAAVEWVGMGLFNRLAGAAFGLVKGGAVLVLVTLLIGLTPLERLQAWQQATLRPGFVQLKDWAIGRLADWEDRLPVSPGTLGELPVNPHAGKPDERVATP